MSRIKQLTSAFIAPKKPEADAAKPKLEGFRPALPKDEFKKGPAYACSAPFNPAEIKPPPGGFYACRAELPKDGAPLDKPQFSCATDCFPDMKEKLEPKDLPPVMTDCFPDDLKERLQPKDLPPVMTDCFPDDLKERLESKDLPPVMTDCFPDDLKDRLESRRTPPVFACKAEIPPNGLPTTPPIFACRAELPPEGGLPIEPPKFACTATIPGGGFIPPGVAKPFDEE